MKQNVEHIQETIDLIKRYKRVYMPSFQKWGDRPARTREEFHSCGNSACILGYMGLTESFRDAGGRVSGTGNAIMEGVGGASSCARHFNIPIECAEYLVRGAHDYSILHNWPLWGWETAVDALERTRDFDFTAVGCESRFFRDMCIVDDWRIWERPE